MKKTAIFLVFTLLLTMVGGMTTVWAANAPDIHESFEVDAETGLVIYGDQLTVSPTLAGAKDGYFNNTGTYRFLYLPVFNPNTSPYAWVNYNLNVETPGSYKVTARVSTNVRTDKRGILELSRMNFNKTASTLASTANNCDVVLSKTLIPNSGEYANVTVDLGIIDLPAGVTTVGVKNIGDVTAYVHNLTFTPSEKEVAVRDREDYIEAYGRASNVIDKDEIKTQIFHKVINASTDPNPSYMIHKVYSSEEKTYNLSYRYLQATQNSKIKVEVGTVPVVEEVEPTEAPAEDGEVAPITAEAEEIVYTTQIEEATFPNKVSNIQFYDAGQITLSKGYNYIKTTAAYGDFYLGTMKLEEADAEVENVIKLTNTDTTLLTVPSVTTGFTNNDFEFVVNTEKAGSYDVRMQMYPSGPAYNEHRFLFTVNGVEQSYSGIKTDFYKEWKTVTIGRVNLPAGTSTLKVTTLYAYGNNLEGVNEFVSVFNYMTISLRKTGTKVAATTKNADSTTTDIFYKATTTNGIRFVPENSATFTATVDETGVYDLSADLVSKSNGAAWTMTVNGVTKSFDAYGKFDESDTTDLGKVYLEKGENVITLTLNKGIAVDLINLYLDADQNAIQLYRDSVAVKNEINSIEYLRTIKSDKIFKSGKLIAQVDLSALAGKEVLCVFALYNANNQITKIDCKTVTAAANQKLELTGVELSEGCYAKVFVWDSTSLFGMCELY